MNKSSAREMEMDSNGQGSKSKRVKEYNGIRGLGVGDSVECVACGAVRACVVCRAPCPCLEMIREWE